MKKRFFNALILGAVLLSTGAVTSCKDYDDDISNLQEQVNKLAQLESLKTDVATLQSAVTAAQGDATKALADAKAAADKADKAATADQLKALDEAVKKAQADIAALGDKADKADVKALEDLIAEYKGEMDKLSANVADQLKDALEKYALTTDVNALAARVAALETAKPGEGDLNIDELKKWYENLLAQAEKLGIAVSTMITDIQLYGGVNYSNLVNGNNGFDNDLSFLYIAETADYTWYKDLNKGLTALDDTDVLPTEEVVFKQDGAYFGSDSLLVRVSPATATLKAENISFINSQGKSLDGIVEIEDVHKFEGLLTKTRANASETGLWVVKVKPSTTKNDKGAEVLDTKAFGAATIAKVNDNKTANYITYAVAVKNFGNETAEDETRRVTSEYDVTAATNGAKQAGEFTVNGTMLKNIYNRHDHCEDVTVKTGKQELVWKAKTEDGKYGPQTTVIYEKDKTGDKYNAEGGDNRQAEAILPVELGKDITIDFTYNEDKNPNGAGDVKGFFVVLDERNALESAPTEIRGWKSYNYTGVGYTDNSGTVHNATYFEGNVGAIRVNDIKDAEGDVIGFRVYAVNYDGTLVDPDGQAFYVVLSKEIQDNTKEANANYESVSRFASEMIPAEDIFGKGYKDLGAQMLSKVSPVGKDASGSERVFGIELYEKANDAKSKALATFDPTTNDWTNGSWDGDNTEPEKDMLTDDGSRKVDWSKVNFVKVFFATPGQYVDGAKYTQEFYMTKNSANTEVKVRKVTVSATKVMPTAPELAFRTGQSKYQWIIPSTGFKVLEGDKRKGGDIRLDAILMEKASNGWGALTATTDNHFTFTIAASALNGDKNKYSEKVEVKNDGTSNWAFNIASNEKKAKIVDNSTSHAVSAEYFFKGISKKYVAETKSWTPNLPYTAKLTNSAVSEFVYCSWTKDFTTDDTNWKAEPIAWDEETGAVTKTQANNILNWTSGNAQSLDLGKIAVSSDMTGLGIKANDLKDRSLGQLIEEGYLTVTGKDLTGDLGEKNPYFSTTGKVTKKEVEKDGKTVVSYDLPFTKNTDVNSPLQHDETLGLKVMDCFGNEYTVKLTVKVQP